MLQSEFMKKVADEKINLDKLNVVIGRTTNVPFSLGCFKEDSVWKIYEVGERQDFGIISEGSEDEIFDKMYRLIMGEIKSRNRMKKDI